MLIINRQLHWAFIATAFLASLVLLGWGLVNLVLHAGLDQDGDGWAFVCVLSATLIVVLSLDVIRLSRVLDRVFVFANDECPQVVTDRSGIICDMNPAAAQIFSGNSLFDALPSLMRTDEGKADVAAFETLRLACRSAARGRLACRMGLTPAEPLRQMMIRLDPIAGASGRMIWRFEDHTETDQIHQILLTQNSQFQTFLDTLPVGLCSLDEAGVLRLVNKTFAEWFGRPQQEFTDQQVLFDSLLMPGPGSALRFDPKIAYEGIDLSLCGRSGKGFSVALSQGVSTGGHGVQTATMMRLLPPEREDGLSRRRFQRFFEIAPVGIALVDEGCRFQETNRSFDLLLNGTSIPIAGRLLNDFIQEDYRDEVEARLLAVAAGEVIGRPIEVRLKVPHEKTVALFVSRLDEADGTLAGYILHFIDLTEQKNLELQFAQSQKMQAVGQLAGGVAHDFNNLLTAMIGFCDLLLLRFRPGDQSFADIMQIKQNANRAANLVRQLLAFSRQQTLQPKIIDIGDVLSELSHLLNRLLGENVELQVIKSRDLGRVKVDQGQLEQVIINLAVNARDAMPGGGVVTIHTQSIDVEEPLQRDMELIPAGSYILVQVSDTGTGIPKEIIGRIFEPFFSTKEVGSGTGLGLSTVYGIVKQTGGFIFVDSQINIGTTFSIYLPRYAQVLPDKKNTPPEIGDTHESTDNTIPRDLTGVGTILLVEDEDPVRMFSARALRNKGYVVHEAKSGEAALKILDDTQTVIDLMITDVVMPRMDGPTLVRVMRETKPDLKVIFISGYTEDTFRRRLDDEEGIHFLAKPFSLKQLVVKVKETLEI